MSWLSKLYKTYDQAIILNEDKTHPIEPVYHKSEKCHILITITEHGEFIKATTLLIEQQSKNKIIIKGTDNIIPVTPKSLTGKTSGPAPYGLAEKLHYLVHNYQEFDLLKKNYFNEYYNALTEWCASDYSHWKAEAIKIYLKNHTIIDDLANSKLIYIDNNNFKLKWDEKNDKPNVYKLSGFKTFGDLVITWEVYKPKYSNSSISNDITLIDSWVNYQRNINVDNGICHLLGKNAFCINTHPKSIIQTKEAAGSKLISAPSNTSYLTYQGRFTSQEQACQVSFEVSQKAHNVLRWLIKRNNALTSPQSAIIAWAVNQPNIPQPLESLDDPEALFSDDWGNVDNLTLNTEPALTPIEPTLEHSKDLGQRFGHLFSEKLKGKFSGAPLAFTDSIVVMALDSATPGRMGVTYYRDFQPVEYLSNLEAWHRDCAWWQRASKEKQDAGKPKWYRCAPSNWAILEAVYGDIIKSNEALKKNLSERLLPSIIDKQSIPLDIMRRATYRATQRHSFKLDQQWQWEQNLGVACALYRGYATRTLGRHYVMALETNNTSRDYLYGRLLAVAENIEQFSLDKSGEKRLTNAGRLMQRFADRPFTTWKTIELSLLPYIQRLQNTHGGFITTRKQLLDQIHSLFNSDSFNSDKALSAEFLLGFHSQRLELMTKKTTTESELDLIN